MGRPSVQVHDRFDVGSRVVSLCQRRLREATRAVRGSGGGGELAPLRTAPIADLEQLEGNGLTLRCADGTEYLDAVSGTFNLPLGYDHPEVVARVRDQVSRISHVSSHFSQRAVDHVARKLLAWAPPGLGAVWMRDVTGSTAVECAVKIAQKATGKTDVISLFQDRKSV